ncbi:MAG TPA: DUF481 domain-containing protein [Kofleriaceae bacterium]|nr:DUF481 domain-containing protein [Kofleriaceae bacterium]
MSRAWFVFAVVAAISVTARGAHAQIVNVQGALAKPPATDGIAGQVEIKGAWREGNNPLFDVGGAGNLLVRRGPVLGLVLARGEYGTSRGITLTRKSFEHVRARVTLDCRWRWEAFAQHEYDQFRRLSLRALVGTGPALQLIDTKAAAMLAGAAYLYEVNQLDTRAGTIDAGERKAVSRASIYLTGHENVAAAAAFVETVYVQPRLDDPDDLRLLGELSIVTKLSTWLSLKNSFTAAYDRSPPDRIKRYDTQLDLGAVVTF